MKSNNSHGKLPPAQRPLRVLIIAGSQRREDNCPGMDSKARFLMHRMADRLPENWEIDSEDLGNIYGREKIQSCNACVSTSMALCVWPCNCYEKNSREEPDLMWNRDLYARLDLADAWAFIAPINWYGPTSNLKLMFDRLVCMNGGNPRERLIDIKNHKLAMKLEHSPRWKKLSLNHLEGRSAGIFFYGDDGADEIDKSGRPKMLRHKNYFNPRGQTGDQLSYEPIKWQLRYSGIEIPDKLCEFVKFGRGKPYSDNQAENLAEEKKILESFDRWTNNFAKFTAEKGKIKPGKYRAYGLKRKARGERF
ncbi:MAG: NAD(P)H-dependent oxidoreductase [bacterium]|nr:NAD(P)H-dependent oxidoreductase [bacterium]